MSRSRPAAGKSDSRGRPALRRAHRPARPGLSLASQAVHGFPRIGDQAAPVKMRDRLGRRAVTSSSVRNGNPLTAAHAQRLGDPENRRRLLTLRLYGESGTTHGAPARRTAPRRRSAGNRRGPTRRALASIMARGNTCGVCARRDGVVARFRDTLCSTSFTVSLTGIAATEPSAERAWRAPFARFSSHERRAASAPSTTRQCGGSEPRRPGPSRSGGAAAATSPNGRPPACPASRGARFESAAHEPPHCPTSTKGGIVKRPQRAQQHGTTRDRAECFGAPGRRALRHRPPRPDARVGSESRAS